MTENNQETKRGTVDINKGDVVTLEIVDISDDGRGIGRAGGPAVFVEGGGDRDSIVLGDVVKARVKRVKKNYLIADALEVSAPSPVRISQDCPYYGRCGGCDLREMEYDAELHMKRDHVISKLQRIGGIEDPVVHEVTGSKDLAGYRNKATYTVGRSGEVGFLERGSHRVIDVPHCEIQCGPANAAAAALRKFISDTGGDHITSMIVKTSFTTGEVMVVLEADDKDIPGIEQLAEMLDDAVYDQFYSLESMAMIYNGKCRVIAGKHTITDEVVVNGRVLKFEIGPESFYQVNPGAMVDLYKKAGEYAALTGDEALFDLYCGVGTIGLTLSNEAAHVIGIELIKPAVIDANRNATINGIVNATYHTGRAEDVLPDIISGCDTEQAIAIIDPPRAGCDEALIRTIAESGIPRVVYISCDPGTLARDVKLFTGLGYDFIEATPVDMFPRTLHVECVCLMSRTK